MSYWTNANLRHVWALTDDAPESLRSWVRDLHADAMPSDLIYALAHDAWTAASEARQCHDLDALGDYLPTYDRADALTALADPGLDVVLAYVADTFDAMPVVLDSVGAITDQVSDALGVFARDAAHSLAAHLGVAA